MPPSLRLRLSVLMFLQYGIMGLWAVTFPTFLKAAPHEGGLYLSAGDVGLIYGTLAIGATVSPLFVGLLADRLFATQRVLSMLHVLGAVLLVGIEMTCEHHRDEVEYHFQKLTMAEPAGGAELWRRLWEQESLRLYLADPVNYGRGNAVRFPPQIERVLAKFGFVPRRPIRLDHPAVWASAEAGQQRLAELERLVTPALQRVLANPELAAVRQRAVPPLFGLMFAYSCIFLPTLTLASALTFRNLPDPARQFGQVRALGTIGWMAAGVFVGVVLPAVSALSLGLAAVASLVLAGFALWLPHTPPASKPRSVGDALGLPAVRMLAERSFLVFLLTSLASTFLMAFHNVFANPFLVDLRVPAAAAAQSLGQTTEVAGILLIPFIRGRIGTKWLLLVGLVASAARFLAYASQSWTGVLAVGLPLHGVGFSFFYITAAIYIDQQAPPDLRASAQGLVMLLTVGAGALLGNWFAGRVVDWHTTGDVVDWGRVWLVPALGTLAAAVFFGLCFREPPSAPLPVPTADEIGEEGAQLAGA